MHRKIICVLVVSTVLLLIGSVMSVGFGSTRSQDLTQEAYFSVDLIDYDSNVTYNDTLIVEYNVTNKGEEGMDTIEFLVNGELVDEKIVNLGAGDSYTGEFLWEPDEGYAGTNTLRVESDDDFIKIGVVIEGKEGSEDDEGFLSRFWLFFLIVAIVIILRWELARKEKTGSEEDEDEEVEEVSPRPWHFERR